MIYRRITLLQAGRFSLLFWKRLTDWRFGLDNANGLISANLGPLQFRNY